jgi:hypothetical protein
MIMKNKNPLGLLTLLALSISLAVCYAQSYPTLASSVDSGNSNGSQNEPLNKSGALSLSAMEEMLLYENKEYGFSLSYPSTWIVQEPDPNDKGIVAGFLAPGEDMNNPAIYIYVQIETLPIGQKITLEQYSQAVTGNLKAAASNLEILTDSDISIGGQPGHAIAYNLNSQGIVFRVLKAWTLKDETAYVFTYNAPNDRYEEFAGDASKIIGSL